MQFLRLNVISLLYAFFLFIAVEFMLNVASISNLTSDQKMIVNIMAVITFLVVVFGAGGLLVFLTKRWFGKQRIRFWTTILWVPYFALFVFVLSQAFPRIAGPMPTNPLILWVLVGTLISYPFYILLINLFRMR